MKKKWLISSGIFALVGGGVFLTKKLFKKDKSIDDIQREEITDYFEKLGYKVHRYNENNDFILFNNEKNEKKHVLYDNGNMDEKEWNDKLNSYYYHFTNEFYFIAKDKDTLFYKTKPQFNTWFSSISNENYSNDILVHYTTFDKLKENHDHAWETIDY